MWWHKLKKKFWLLNVHCKRQLQGKKITLSPVRYVSEIFCYHQFLICKRCLRIHYILSVFNSYTSRIGSRAGVPKQNFERNNLLHRKARSYLFDCESRNHFSLYVSVYFVKSIYILKQKKLCLWVITHCCFQICFTVVPQFFFYNKIVTERVSKVLKP